MFSPVLLAGHSALKIMGLAPMAVLPEHQRTGIGSALVRAGLEACSDLGYGAVVVLGHPEYYPRFGFKPSTRFGIGCEYEVPEEVFMAIELQPGYLATASGKVQYHEAIE
jgi:putative acetyltransferase